MAKRLAVVYVGAGMVFVRAVDGSLVGLSERVCGVVGGPSAGGDFDVDTVDGVGGIVVDEDVAGLGGSSC